MRKKKSLSVLIISRAFPPDINGGVATHVDYLSDSLSRITDESEKKLKKCFVHILTPSLKDKKAQKEGRPPSLSIHRFKGQSGHFTSVGEIPSEEVVQHALDEWEIIKPDIIHAHDFESLLIGLMLKTAHKTPLLLTVHRTPKDPDKSLPKRDVKDCFLQTLINFNLVDKFIAPSEAYKQNLINKNCPEEKISRIYHGIPINKLATATSHPEILEEIGIRNDHEVIFCPSRIDQHKRIDTFIEAARIVSNNFPEKKLLFVVAGGSGEKNYCEKLKNQIRRLNLDNIIRLGISFEKDINKRDMPTLYRRSKICVLPSQREGFGQAVLESFVYKKPIIASNTGGIPEIISSDQYGLLFNCNEHQDLAKQIIKLLRHPSIAKNIGKNAFNLVSDKFNADTMAKNYFSLYRKIADVDME